MSTFYQRLGAGVICWLFGVSAPITWSESGFEHDHGEAEASAHVHGEASMQVNLQENMLGIRLVIPAMDLLGYERAPHTAAEQTQLAAALEFLEHSDNWIELVAEARCTSQSHTVKHPYRTADPHAEKEISHHHDTKPAHTDFVIGANWQCADASRLNSLTLSLFKQFPRIREVKADWIGESAAGIAQLTAAEPRLFLSKP